MILKSACTHTHCLRLVSVYYQLASSMSLVPRKHHPVPPLFRSTGSHSFSRTDNALLSETFDPSYDFPIALGPVLSVCALVLHIFVCLCECASLFLSLLFRRTANTHIHTHIHASYMAPCCITCMHARSILFGSEPRIFKTASFSHRVPRIACVRRVRMGKEIGSLKRYSRSWRAIHIFCCIEGVMHDGVGLVAYLQLVTVSLYKRRRLCNKH